MPHSSGGGSSFGGSHSSSSHSSGGSGGSSQKISNTPFAGSHRYVYYRHGAPIYYYSTSVAPSPKGTMFACIFMTIITAFIGIMVLTNMLIRPKKVNGYYDYNIRIEDNQSILGDTTNLNDTLTKFRDKTGITTYILTVDKSSWDNSSCGYSMEKFAYNTYVDTLHDECHWLIVITYNNKDDWFFEGMQGDNTDNVLTEKKANRFNKSLVKNIKNDSSVEQALTDSFEKSLDYMMKIEIDFSAIGSGAFLMLISIGSLVFGIYFYNKSKGRETAKEIKENEKETVCAYCEGRYILSTVTSCPHCGASISKIERMQAEENSVKE